MGRKKKTDWKKASVSKAGINHVIDYDKPYMMKVEFIGSQDSYDEMETVLISILRTMELRKISKYKTDDGYIISFQKHNYKGKDFSI